MKKFTFILLAFVASIFFITTTGCGTDDEPTAPKKADTTSTDTTITDPTDLPNKITVGFDDYTIATEASKTFGEYNTGKNETYLTISGQDSKNGQVDFQIEIPGNTTGSFQTGTTGNSTFELGTGTIGDVRREEFSASNSDFTIVVTEYGAVGEMIKGTFSGEVKNGKTGVTIKITKGEFEVLRRDDA